MSAAEAKAISDVVTPRLPFKKPLVHRSLSPLSAISLLVSSVREQIVSLRVRDVSTVETAGVLSRFMRRVSFCPLLTDFQFRMQTYDDDEYQQQIDHSEALTVEMVTLMRRWIKRKQYVSSFEWSGLGLEHKAIPLFLYVLVRGQIARLDLKQRLLPIVEWRDPKYRITFVNAMRDPECALYELCGAVGGGGQNWSDLLSALPPSQVSTLQIFDEIEADTMLAVAKYIATDSKLGALHIPLIKFDEKWVSPLVSALNTNQTLTALTVDLGMNFFGPLTAILKVVLTGPNFALHTLTVSDQPTPPNRNGRKSLGQKSKNSVI